MAAIKTSINTHSELLRTLLKQYSNNQSASPALVFLDDGDEATSELTYEQLYFQACLFADGLNRQDLVGERVLLLMPSSIEYVVAFLGCLFAGVIAVPVYPPRNGHHAKRMLAIIDDANAKACLVLSNSKTEVTAALSDTLPQNIDIIGFDDIAHIAQGAWVNESVSAEQIAYLQYTSGSTGVAKGVMVCHHHLVNNCLSYADAASVNTAKTFVSWLPIFHDMGLVQGIIMPLALGATAVFMPPASFIQRPLRWLTAIDKYQASFSGCPNFAYQLCVDQITDEQAEELNLSSWQVALNAAEPISVDTVAGFLDKFAISQFKASSLVGGYGLAEATLYVTCDDGSVQNKALYIERKSLEDDVILVTDSFINNELHTAIFPSGVLGDEPQIAIIDPKTAIECDNNQVGEIWVSGNSVSQGYWNKAGNDEIFSAQIKSDSTNPAIKLYLRTGDLGFVRADKLYVTGRIKDLIIIRGANHYPQDIELTCENSHPDIRKSGWGAVFSTGSNTEQKLVVVQEINQAAYDSVDVSTMGLLLEKQIRAVHGIAADTIVFVRSGSIPKTSSGKIQRTTCQQWFVANELNEIGRWEKPEIQKQYSENNFISLLESKQSLIDWLVKTAADITDREITDIAPSLAFTDLGLDSLTLAQFAEKIASASGFDIQPSLFFEYPSIASLADHMVGYKTRITTKSVKSEPIAIIGMDCVFPQANTLNEFWSLLTNGENAITEISAQRQKLTGFKFSENSPYRKGGFIDNVAGFDAGLFNISPREAINIDPQQRLLLETVWGALEHANIAPDSLSGSATGVYVGISNNDYFRLQRDNTTEWDYYSGTGSAFSVAANRISYSLDLKGPSLAIDTACSSSLVAVHQACRSLALGETDLALAGGVNLILASDYGEIFAQSQMLSPNGQCQTFSDSADGYVRGEGGGVVVLKRLVDAERDGDVIYGVVRGSAVNQDGASNGLTAPNGLAQQQVISNALNAAGFEAGDIDYIEAHGTGTPLGDPIEVNALKAVMDGSRGHHPCLVGAVKTNIGHLESAAGIAGLIKTTLILQHGDIPVNQNYAKLNPSINLDSTRIQLATESNISDYTKRPSVAGVSSFGFGGTNAHLVLSAYKESDVTHTELATDIVSEHSLFTISADSESSLFRLANAYKELLAGDVMLNALCKQANQSRAQLKYRLAIVASSTEEVISELESDKLNNSVAITGCVSKLPRIAAMFTGQGSQYIGMGRTLYKSEPVYQRMIDKCDGILEKYLSLSIKDIMFADEDNDKIHNTQFSQPALVVTEIALFELWKSWGITPEFVLGHSIGEYAAAYAANVLDLDTALRLVAVRGKLMASAPGQGAMIAVNGNSQDVKACLDSLWNTVDLAGVNSPGNLVLSGDVTRITDVSNLLVNAGFDVTTLKVSHAFHSQLMDSVLAEFEPEFTSVILNKPSIEMITTGGSRDITDKNYWIQQLRNTVSFADGVTELESRGVDTFLELGPRPVLSQLGQQNITSGRWLASLTHSVDDNKQIRTSLATLFTNGTRVDFSQLDKHIRPAKLTLPRYPFEHTDYWFKESKVKRTSFPRADIEYVCGNKLDLAIKGIHCFESYLPDVDYAYLYDHKVQQHSVLPGAAYISLMMSALTQSNVGYDPKNMSLSDIAFNNPIDLQRQPHAIQTVVQQVDGLAYLEIEISVQYSIDDDWISCAIACVTSDGASTSPDNVAPVFDRHVANLVDLSRFYQHWHELGLQYDHAFQTLTELSLDDDKVSGQLKLQIPEDKWLDQGIHPTLLDGAFQSLGAVLLTDEWADVAEGKIPLPTSIDSIKVFATGLSQLTVHAAIRPEETDEHQVVADITLRDSDNNIVVLVQGLLLTWVNALALENTDNNADIYAVEWTDQTFNTLQVVDDEQQSWVVITGGNDVAEITLRYPENTLFIKTVAELASISTPVIDRIVFISEANIATNSEAFIAQSIVICQSVQALVLAVNQLLNLAGNAQVVIVTQDAESLANAGLAGMVKAAANEYPQLNIRHLSLPQNAEITDWDMATNLIAGEWILESNIQSGCVYKPKLIPVIPFESQRHSTVVKEHALYLITGGYAGLGFETAKWLVAQGAKYLLLVGRSGTPTAEIKQQLDMMIANGIDIQIGRYDLSIDSQAQQLIQDIQQSDLPLAGIIHAAGMLDDKPLADMDTGCWSSVINTKIIGAYHLDLYTRDMPVDFFVTYSSISAVLGSAGQCNYAAANAMLDALMLTRHEQGLAGLSINWGPWANVGMASSDTLSQRLIQQGISPLLPAEAITALDNLLSKSVSLATPAQAFIANIDWSVFAKRASFNIVPSHYADLLIDTHLMETVIGEVELPTLGELTSLPTNEALNTILIALGELIGQVLRMQSPVLTDLVKLADLDLSSLGMDSLLAMELRNRIRAWVDVDLPAHLLIGNNKMLEIAETVHQKVLVSSLSVAAAESDDFDDESMEEFVL